MYVGVHYPLDVLAGCVLGVVVASTLSWVVATVWRFLPLSQEASQGGRRRISIAKIDHR
jgi:membrane-associated phospholipid phosphatase